MYPVAVADYGSAMLVAVFEVASNELILWHMFDWQIAGEFVQVITIGRRRR